MKLGYLLYCDESVKKGIYYSNFYGGLMIERKNFEKVNNELKALIENLNISGEIKWVKVNNYTLESYTKIIELLFSFVIDGKVKIRVMFTDNRNQPRNLTTEQKNNQYHILYYHFIKHAFGFANIQSSHPVELEIYFDNIPESKERNYKFKKFIYGVQFLPDLIDSKISIGFDNIYEVCSKKHVLLQCLDLVLGAMAFRMNDLHLEKTEGSSKRGKRTIAKEKLYKVINKKIREIYPNFNIGISTGTKTDLTERFSGGYRHWVFKSKDSE